MSKSSGRPHTACYSHSVETCGEAEQMYQEIPWRLLDVKQERKIMEDPVRLLLVLNGTVGLLQTLFLVGTGIFPSTGCFEIYTSVLKETTALPPGISHRAEAPAAD